MFEFDRCVIVDQSKAPIAEGFVRAFEKGEMDFTSNRDISTWLHAGQSVSVYIYNASMGECVYEGVVKTAILHHVQLGRLKLVTNRQKRSNTRVNTELAYVVRYYCDVNHPDEELAFEKPVAVTILNVSAEGFLISCKERYDIGFTFVFTFREAARDIPLHAEVVRRVQGDYGFRYGCRTIGLPVNDQNEIHRWVFSQQIELRRQHRM